MQDKWKALEDNLKIIGFEPNEEEYARLVEEDSKNTIFNTALWNEKQEINFYITKADKLCSCLKPNNEVLSDFPESDRFDVLKNNKGKTTILSKIDKDDLQYVYLGSLTMF